MKKGLIITLVTSVLVLGGGAAGTAAYAYQYGKDDRLPERFTIGGWQAGGMSAAAALEQLRVRLEEPGNVKVEALAPDSAASRGGKTLPSLTLKQLGLKLDAADAAQAIQRYRELKWWDRALQRFKGEAGASYPITVGWDDAALDREARGAWGGVGGAVPRDAKREINDRDEVVYTPEVLGTQVDWKTLTADVKKLAPSSLVDEGGNKTVNVPLIATSPKVTVASLKEEGIDRKIAEFTTSFTTSASGRSHNVTAAAKALNETLLAPGEVFEYGKIVEKAQKEYGYKEAPVILKGKLTPGIGGGICQVSSTLYNAILMAGLDVVERRNHSLVVHYLPPGLDATYADGYVNFRFRNSTGKQLLIRTVVENKRVTIKLFGTLPDNVSYRTETKQLKTIPPQTKYVANDKLTLGQQERLQKGEPGYVVDTYRIKLVNGKVESREKLPRSSYMPQEELIAVHPDDPRLNPLDTTPAPSVPEGPVEPV